VTADLGSELQPEGWGGWPGLGRPNPPSPVKVSFDLSRVHSAKGAALPKRPTDLRQAPQTLTLGRNAPLTIPGLSLDASGAFRPGQRVLHHH